MCKLNSLTRVRVISALFLLAAAAGCKKENPQDTEAAKEEFANIASKSDAEAEVIFSDVFDNVMGVNDEVAVGGTGIFETTSNTCYTVNITQTTSVRFPLKVEIDFGAGCTGQDGRTRKGRIIIVYTGRLVIPGNSATTTFDGYYINGVRVEGVHKVTNTGTQDKKSFTIAVQNAKITKPNGNYSRWNSERTITQTGGANTPLIALDDVFTITGQANGTVLRDDKLYQWATAITEPLTRKFACRWIVMGTIAVKKSSSTVAVLDYGTGVCDNKATFTVNGTAHEISLD